ncbi:MAG: undecaprenyl-diphosphate phosphatase, partial [Phycisphaerae bacterium]
MSDLLRSIILGVIEGLTEFLPVSSTGHLILAMPLLGVDSRTPPWNTFLFLVQVGAILAVIVYFRRPLADALTHRSPSGRRAHLFVKLAVAFAPAAVVGLLLDDWMESRLGAPVPIAIALIAGAGIMESIERGH